MSPDDESIVTGAADETLNFWHIFSQKEPEKVGRSSLDLHSCIRWAHIICPFHLLLYSLPGYVADLILLITWTWPSNSHFLCFLCNIKNFLP